MLLLPLHRGMLAVMTVVLLVLVALAFSGRRWWQRRGALKAGVHAGHRQGHGQVAHMPQGTEGRRGRGII